MMPNIGSHMADGQLLPRFAEGFLKDHAGQIISNAHVAIIEIVANCWDAGADRVDIEWPEAAPGPFTVRDNGTGMTAAEFEARWVELAYSRLVYQGEDVEFPPENRHSLRKAFGRNGKGRHAFFCFSDEYVVITSRHGEVSAFRVRRSNWSTTPFTIERANDDGAVGHGTMVRANVDNNHLEIGELRELIGSKFLVDPAFSIYVNGAQVELTDLAHVSEVEVINVGNYGSVTIRRLDTQVPGRTTRLNGVAWWVNKRIVGEPSWRGVEGPYLDGRSQEARRYTFVVEADFLAD